MVCTVELHQEPQLRDPVLIEGLPGIGLVANLAVSHLIKELKAEPFGEIHSASFQDVAFTTVEGKFTFPMSRLYYCKSETAKHDLILLYGNSQALTTRGQYELCWKILDVAEKLGCRRIVTLGGYRPGREVREPKLYCAASDAETVREIKMMGANILTGQILGVAGLLIGLSDLRKMKGFCLLAETPGGSPDKIAAHEVLRVLNKKLELNLNLEKSIDDIDAVWGFEPVELGVQLPKRQTPPEWFI